MTNALKSFLFFCIGDNAFLGVCLSSTLPMIEARGSIPLGLTAQIFSTPIHPFLCGIASLIGSTIMTLIILLAIFPLMKYLKKFKSIKDFYDKLCLKLDKHNTNLKSKTSEFKKYFYLSLLCALPIPLTGYYTSSLIAGFCNLKMIPSLIAICTGNLICIVLVLCFATLLKDLSIYIFYAFFLLFIFTIIFFIIQYILTKFKNNKHNENI